MDGFCEGAGAVFFGVVVFILGEKKVCPLCGRRLLDVRRDRAYEVAFELRCPHCGKIVRIVLPARAGLRN